MIWFDKLSDVLSAYYLTSESDPIVGYLKGSGDPRDWVKLMFEKNREQMIVLGSLPPTMAVWQDAGVAAREGGVQTVRLSQLAGYGLMIIYAGAKSRPWGHITQFSKATEDAYEANTLEKFRYNVPKKSTAGKQAVIERALDLLGQIEIRANELERDHKSQEGLLRGSEGHLSGFMGFWANHLYNTDVPPRVIWLNVTSALLHARSMLKEGNMKEAGRAIVDARAAYLQASAIYIKWKDGIDGAAKKMQVRIAEVSLALIVAAAAATAATALAAGSAAGGATASVQSVTSAVIRADAAFTRVVLSDTAAKAGGSIFTYGEALEVAGEEVAEMLEMVR